MPHPNPFKMVDDNLYLSLKWSLILITVVNILYTIYIFMVYLKGSAERRVPLVVWSLCGIFVFAVGLYGAALESEIFLILFVIVLILNLVFGFFQHEIYKGSVILYLLLILLTVLFTWIVYQRHQVAQQWSKATNHIQPLPASAWHRFCFVDSWCAPVAWPMPKHSMCLIKFEG